MDLYIKGYIFLVLILAVQGDWIFPDKVQFDLSEVLNKRCGETPYTERLKPENGRIFENPWLIMFRHPEENDGFCHGTLLTERHVLTTAICTETIVLNETIAVLGEYERNRDLDCDSNGNCTDPIMELTIGNYIAHPGFKGSSFEYDIALVVLNANVTYSNSIQPICLPLTPIIASSVHIPVQYDVLWPEEGALPKQIPMKYVPHAICEKFTANLLILHEGQICAKYERQMATRLMNGSGSPLLVEFHDRIFQLGILSIGLANATYRDPYVYVNITTHANWIHNTILNDMQ